jgi:hypothetical protein
MWRAKFLHLLAWTTRFPWSGYTNRIGPPPSVLGRSHIIEQVASNKLSLILKIILQNMQALQLFTKIIKTESMYKSY